MDTKTAKETWSYSKRNGIGFCIQHGSIHLATCAGEFTEWRNKYGEVIRREPFVEVVRLVESEPKNGGRYLSE